MFRDGPLPELEDIDFAVLSFDLFAIACTPAQITSL
jgi:hypothetical protein